MKISYSVSFEFDSRPPLNHRGAIEGALPSTCVARAIRQAQRVLRPTGWSSVVAVVDRHGFSQLAEPETTRESNARDPNAQAQAQTQVPGQNLQIGLVPATAPVPGPARVQAPEGGAGTGSVSEAAAGTGTGRGPWT